VPPLARRKRNIKDIPVLTTTPGEENVSMHEISVKMRYYKLKEERTGVL
jgi:hypothetical protein